MHPVRNSILKVAAYFDLFDYPVTLDEIKFFLDQPYAESLFVEEMDRMVNAGLLYRLNGFYCLRPDYRLVERRLAGNSSAEKQLKLAAKIARFLARFPYVRGVAVSGSLSKNFAYPGSDIDFFVITKENRLWVARFMFTCFLLLAKLVGLKSWFCLNYFIDTAAAEIPEKNIYTAIEIATLMPMQGKKVFRDFYRRNKWMYKYLPNSVPGNDTTPDNKRSVVATIIEWLLNNRVGDKFENFICNFYRKRWQRMLAEDKYAKNGFHLGSYIAGDHVCKPIPHYFQSKILNRLEQKLKELDSIPALPQQIAV